MARHNTLAAVDLGSNSFHLQIGRVVDGHVRGQAVQAEQVEPVPHHVLPPLPKPIDRPVFLEGVPDADVLRAERVAVVYPRQLPWETYRWLKQLGFTLIEIPTEEHHRFVPANLVVVEPGVVIMPGEGGWAVGWAGP